MNWMRQVLSMPLRERRNRGSIWLTWMLCGLIVASLPIGLAPIQGAPQLAALIAGVFVVMLVLLWWSYFCSAVLQQASPTNVRLVPGLPRKLRIVWIGTWLAAATVASVPFAAAGFGMLFAGLIAASVLAVVALGIALPWVWIAVIAGAWLASRADTGALLAYARSDAGLLVMTALAVAGVGLALRLVVGNGGQAHRRRWAASLLARGYASGQRRDVGPPSWRRTLRPTWMARLRHRWRLPRFYPTWFALALPFRNLSLWMLPLMLLLLGGFTVLAPSALSELSLPYLASMLAAVAAVEIRKGFRSTRGEQALLRLMPAAPAAPRLNRELSLSLMVCWLTTWFAYAVGSALFIELLQIDRSRTWPGWLACFAAVLLFGVFLLLDDFARNRRGSERWLELSAFALPAAAGLLSALASLGTVAVAVALALACAAPLLLWRWRRMLRAPPAYPTGRLA